MLVIIFTSFDLFRYFFESLGKFPDRDGSVAYRVLFVGRKFRKRFAERLIIEQRIVSEAALAALSVEDHAAAFASYGKFRSIRKHAAYDGDEFRTSAVRFRFCQLFKQFCVVIFII